MVTFQAADEEQGVEFLYKKFEVDPALFDGPVMVTGAGGCIGAWVLAILTGSNVPVVACDLADDRRRPALIMGPEKAAELVWETADISDAARLTEIAEKHGVRALIHLAGLQVPFCKANPALGARVNVEGTINMLELARQRGLKRVAYASSTAALSMPPGGEFLETLYGAYKAANEYTAFVYWQDWQIPSVGIRPNFVYGLARDQGLTSKCTTALHAAVAGEPYEIPWTGPSSFIYAGEAAAAFIAAISREGDGSPVFNLNGPTETVATCVELIEKLQPGAQTAATGDPLPFPPDLSDEPIRAYLGNYPSISLAEGLTDTHRAFTQLKAEGRLPPVPA